MTSSPADLQFGSKLETAVSSLYYSRREHSFAEQSGITGVRRSLLMVSDACGIWLVAMLFLVLPFSTNHIQPDRKVVALYIGFVLFYSVLIVLFCHAQQLYAVYRAMSCRSELLAISKSIALATLLLAGCMFIAGSKKISRFTIGGTGGGSLVIMAAWRRFRRYSLRRAPPDGVHCHNILIVGADALARSLRDHLVGQRHLGLVVLGLLLPNECERPEPVHPASEHVLGTIFDLPRLCRTHFVDEIIICAQQRQIVKAVIAKAREYGVGVRVIPDLYDGMAWGARLDHLGAFPALAVVHRHVPAIALKLKRVLDVLISGAGLLLLSPAFLLLAIVVKLDSRGSVFYISQRVGRKGRIFRCYKFRTMVTNADQLKSKLQHLNERDGALFKIRNDPRITRLGRHMRKYSLDELPQLWNVLKGDMSLVGPRPPLASEVKQYELEYLRRLEAAPGITGLWQVQSRTSPSFRDYISLDLKYLENWSLGLDLKILFRTIGVVAAGTGT